VAMVITDKVGQIVQLNRETERLFGYQRDELLGRPVEILIPERFRQGHPALRASFLANPTIRYGSGRELWGLRKDGAEITIELGLSPLETEEGIFVISVIADVTESKRQERWFKALTESFPASLILIDHALVVRLINRETERLFGYSRDELIGRPLASLFPDETCNGEVQSIEQLLTQSSAGAGGHSHEIKGRHRDGAEIIMDARINSLETGERVLVVTPILDLSRRTRA
jgi:PAS domain S-box-containing protein